MGSYFCVCDRPIFRLTPYQTDQPRQFDAGWTVLGVAAITGRLVIEQDRGDVLQSSVIRQAVRMGIVAHDPLR